ncbi:DUF6778 family protein [Pseudooceanicola spongiae]|uniref:Lipoprotein n=1 Tax=Pseudooceanicola spongiae TaxID=2613965 RepID=A0A7L9WKB6_9RHOB|nr:DUF6778 family protein [Pseudooceanicola spongiae]QOL80343.1 hypothetical protein F3W81_05605 [Pseudooceanicola spongiae]
MKLAAGVLVFWTVIALSACENVDDARVGGTPRGATATDGIRLAYDIRAVEVEVSRSLRVSESNSFYPGGDIVWREDPLGDRYEQVATILRDAARQAFAAPADGPPAVAHLRITYFHALTERARGTTGGWHNINFVLSLTEATSGAVLVAPYRVRTQIRGYGGARATEAVHRGETQKVRITRHLIEVLRSELAAPPV